MSEQRHLYEHASIVPDNEARIDSARKLLTHPNPSIALFAEYLGDANWRVRKAAIETFLNLEHPEIMLRELIGLLHRHDNVGLRNAVSEVLIGLGSGALNELQREVTSPNAQVRRFAVDILGEIGDKSCADQLIGALADTDLNVRYAAVETLGKLRIEAAADQLFELMLEPDPGLRFVLLQTLANLGAAIPAERLFPYLQDPLLHKALFNCFAKLGGKDVIPHLLNGLLEPMRHVREAALRALFELRDQEHSALTAALMQVDIEPIADYLERLLSDESSPLKEAALALYALVGHERQLSSLLACIVEEPLYTSTLKVFSSLGEAAFNRLLDSLAQPEAWQQLALICVGGELGFSRILPMAIKGTASADPQLRASSARALGCLGDQRQLALLLQLLEDEDSQIQDISTIAIATLGMRHRPEVLERIAPLLTERDAEKRVRIVRILSQIEGKETESLLLKGFKDSSSSVRCEAIRAIQDRLGDAVISALTLALIDESAEVRRLAVNALSRYPQGQVLPALKRAALDSDLWVRAAVMRAQELYSGDEVRELLLQGLKDKVGLVVIAALESAALILPTERQQLFEQALAHQDEEVVTAALGLLVRFKTRDWIESYGCGLLNHSHWEVRVHAAKVLGQSDSTQVISWLSQRLLVEDEGLVRQAIEAAIALRWRPESQGR